MTESEIREYRLAMAPDGRAYSGAYDCVIDTSQYIIELGTGLKDSEGSQIFQSDVVKNSYGARFLCDYDYENGCFNFTTIDGHLAYSGVYMWAEIQPVKLLNERN